MLKNKSKMILIELLSLSGACQSDWSTGLAVPNQISRMARHDLDPIVGQPDRCDEGNVWHLKLIFIPFP